jgi:hypothetical protein
MDAFTVFIIWNVETKHLIDCFVGLFASAVCFWVISSGHFLFHTSKFLESEEVLDKLDDVGDGRKFERGISASCLFTVVMLVDVLGLETTGSFLVIICLITDNCWVVFGQWRR